jgi:inner membrane transporter RhtA
MQSVLPVQPVFPTTPSVLKASFDRRIRQVGAIGNSIPPSCQVLLSSFVIQIGMALSKVLFDTLGSSGAAFLCKGMAAIMLLFMLRPRLQGHRWQAYGIVGLYGLAIACMNLSIFAAIDRVPLGVASTLEFIGPLGVSVIGSRRPLDLLWVALASTGVFLLAPIQSTHLDPLGIGFALLSGLCWAGYILLSAPVGRAIPGGGGLALGITIAALFMAPFGVSQGGLALLNPWILTIGIAAGLLTTVVPYSLEFVALRRMSPRIFGVLMSVEPAIAALVGLLFLQETLGVQSLVAIALVITAAIGATLWGRQGAEH